MQKAEVKKYRVLVVDDTFDDLQSMRTILEKDGYKVTTATSGMQALGIVTEDGFDLILINIRMPGLSGYDLLRLLREKFAHKIKMAYVTIVPREDVDLDGIDGFIQKPFSPEEFMAEVQRVLKRK